MQKVLQRTAMAKRQAARKAKRAVEMDKAVDRRERRRELQQRSRLANMDIIAARARRRDDWLLGPLAPRRDVGEMRESYGTIDAARAQLPDADPDTKPGLMPFAEGDRVVVLKGRDRGKIGQIRDVDEDSQSVRVKGLNMADLHAPEFMRQHEGDKSAVRTTEIRIPTCDIRLIWSIRDSDTGLKRDVILRDIVRDRAGRSVPGTNIRIPFPRLVVPEPQDKASDTMRISSEDVTFVPTLLRPPMPPSVLDELRNKYSHFRDRHDPEWSERKIADDKLERHKIQSARVMMTPLKALHAKTRCENRAKGWQPLSDKVLAGIGARIAAHKAMIRETVRHA